MQSGRIEYKAEVVAIVLTSALLVKKETRRCTFMLDIFSALLVRERLNFPHLRVRLIFMTKLFLL